MDIFYQLLISYIFIDTSGWVISDVSFEFTGVGSGSCNIGGPRPSDPVGIDLTPTLIPAAKLRIFHTRQMTAEMLHPWVWFIILQQPIRARLYWCLLKLSFKIGRPLGSCFLAAMTSLFGYLFNPLCSFFVFTIVIIHINLIKIISTNSLMHMKLYMKGCGIK